MLGTCEADALLFEGGKVTESVSKRVEQGDGRVTMGTFLFWWVGTLNWLCHQRFITNHVIELFVLIWSWVWCLRCFQSIEDFLSTDSVNFESRRTDLDKFNNIWSFNGFSFFGLERCTANRNHSFHLNWQFCFYLNRSKCYLWRTFSYEFLQNLQIILLL